jgi:hypothetical protein
MLVPRQYSLANIVIIIFSFSMSRKREAFWKYVLQLKSPVHDMVGCK